MSFLQPWVLWGLLGMAVPVIIHLLNRRRFRTVKWAAMEFLLKASQESRGRKKLRHFLILLCRALAVGALALAVARPLLGGFLGWGGASVDTVLVVLDRSASMERVDAEGGESKRARALKQVSAALKEMEGARVYLLESVGKTIIEVPSPSALLDMNAVEGSDGGADLPDLLLQATEFLSESGHGASEIWVASDLQSSNWKSDDVRWNAVRESLASSQVKRQVRVLGFSQHGQENRSVQVHLARRESGGALLEFSIAKDLGGEKDAFPVTFSLMGAKRSEQVSMEAGRLILRREFDLEEGGDTWGWGWVSLPPDANERDNYSYFSFGPEQEVWSYLVRDKELSQEASDVLLRALAPPNYRKLRSEAISPVEWDKLRASKAAVVVWAASLPEEGGEKEVLLREYVEQGGAVIFMPGGGDFKGHFGGISWGEFEYAEEDEFFVINKWRQDEGLLRDGLDGTALPMGSLRAIRRVVPKGNLGELALWEDGEVFVRRAFLGKGEYHFVGCLPDYEWSNMEHAGLHLVLLQRALSFGELRLGGGGQHFVGYEAERRGWERVDKVLGAGASDNSPRSSAGVYRSEEKLAAFNRPAIEDITTVLSQGELEDLFKGASFGFFEEENDGEASLVREVWRAFLILALLFLVIEAILCLQKKSSRRQGQRPFSAMGGESR